jgi:neutral amino acid transport system permease protein
LRAAAVAMLAVLIWIVLPGLARAGEAEGEAVRGMIERPAEAVGAARDQPVEGVKIVVQTAEGEAVGTATTSEDGRWELKLPGPGDYIATIDESTLPEGAVLRNPDRARLVFTISPGQQRTLLFPLGEQAGSTNTLLSQVPQLLVQGLKFGLIIAMTAIGLSLIFGTTGLVNLAHGEFVTIGALVAYFFNAAQNGPGLHLIPAAVLGVVAGGLVGAVMDFGLFKPLRRRGTGLIALLVISIGLSLLLRNIILYIFGGRTRPYADYAAQRAVTIGPISIAPKEIAIMLISIAVIIMVGLLLQRTKIGKAMRAVADNRDLAESCGIDVERVILFVWIFSSALAALGGIFQGLSEQVSFQQGFQLLLLMFAGVILGGLGTAYGALIGSLVVGIAIQLSTLVIPAELKNVPALFILALILLLRPQGILGRPERVG